MKERREEKQTIEIPKGTGRAGFLLAIEEILKLPRVQGIQVDARGTVSFSRFVNEDEKFVPLEVDFETISPYMSIRNSPMVEMPALIDLSPPELIYTIFNEASNDQLFPIAFVTGANSQLPLWLKTSGHDLSRAKDEFFGLPLFSDRNIDDSVLVMCAAHSRGSALVDTQKSYKIVMPTWEKGIL